MAVPSAQTFLNYFLLFVCFTIPQAVKGRLKRSLYRQCGSEKQGLLSTGPSMTFNWLVPLVALADV